MSQPNASFRLRNLATFSLVAFALSNLALVNQAAAQAKPRVPKGGAAAAPGFNQSTVQFDTVIDFKGKLKDSVRNMMVVTRDDGTDVTIKLHDDPTRLRFVADAKRPYVRPQMMARAKVSLGPAGAPIAAVDHIELFQPVPTGAIAGSAKDSFTPGIHSKSHDKPNPQQGFMPGIYDVVGMVVGMDSNGVYLNTGRGTMAVPLSPEAKIGLVYNNLSLAQAGDDVTVSGFHQPPDETQVVANSVVIRTSRVYGDEDENPRRRTPRARGKKPDEPVDAPAEPPAQPE
jgi:hypothetical protein